MCDIYAIFDGRVATYALFSATGASAPAALR